MRYGKRPCAPRFGPKVLKQLAVFGTAVAFCHPEQARNRAAVASNTTTSPRASKFCFLKLPIVFGYAVPFTAISKKQNRKGSPQSLIYPYKGKLTSFVLKQFFRYRKVHQTFSRSRLRRFCSERCIAANADQKANSFYAAVCTLLSPQNFDVRGKRSPL